MTLSFHLSGKFDEAIKEFEKITNLCKNNSDFYYFKGDALAGAGKDYEAIKDYNKAIKLIPTDVGAYTHKGLSLNLKSYEEDIES